MLDTTLAAEIRGNITFTSENGTDIGNQLKNQSIGVIAYPLDRQIRSQVSNEILTIMVKGNNFISPFLIINRGNSVTFINKDDVFHPLILINKNNKEHPFVLKSTKEERSYTYKFPKTDDWFLFCQLHKKSFARIKVVDTPYILNINGPGNFEFTNLPAGQWKIQAIDINDSSASIVAQAYTSPPVVNLLIPVSNIAGYLTEVITLTNNELQPFFPGN